MSRITRILLIGTVCSQLLSGNASGFSTHDTAISRTFDKVEAVVGESITVTVNLSHSEGNELRDLYYADNIPFGLVAAPIQVTINSSDVTDYLFESGSVGAVYPGCIVYRWVLEAPGGGQNNPIPPGASVQIAYSLRAILPGSFNLDEFHWVGYYDQAPAADRAAFGHSEAVDAQTISVLGASACAGTVDASAYGSCRVYEPSELGGHMGYVMLPLGSIVMWRIMRRKTDRFMRRKK